MMNCISSGCRTYCYHLQRTGDTIGLFNGIIFNLNRALRDLKIFHRKNSRKYVRALNNHSEHIIQYRTACSQSDFNPTSLYDVSRVTGIMICRVYRQRVFRAINCITAEIRHMCHSNSTLNTDANAPLILNCKMLFHTCTWCPTSFTTHGFNA